MRARDNLNRALEEAIEPVHCPSCGIYQPDMARALQERYGRRLEPNKYASERIAFPVRKAWSAACAANTIEAYTNFKDLWPTLSRQADRAIKQIKYPPHMRRLVASFGWILWGALVLFFVGMMSIEGFGIRPW
jgi:hypothetical protein